MLGVISVFMFGLCATLALKNPMEDPNLFEGDMILTEEQKIQLEYGEMDPNIPLAATKTNLWPKVILYEIHSSLLDRPRAIAAINAAIEDYEKLTCLRFKNRTTESGGYIMFHIGYGCSSPVGYGTYRVNKIALASGCWYKGTIMHEIAHSLGFYHEQSRPDRDQHVIIKWENIPDKLEYNFKKQRSENIDSMNVPYDYRSVMHYSKTAFSTGGITIQTIDPAMQDVIGRREGFSELDTEQMNLLYKCPGVTKRPPPPTQPPRGCEDEIDGCDRFNDKCGFPASNHWGDYVRKKCKKTCEFCVTDGYIVSDTKKNWHDARAACQNAYGSLVTFENAAENSKLKALILAKGSNDSYWTGLNDIETEGTFTWNSSGSAIPSFRNWSSGEPSGGRAENCVEMKFSSNLEWNDESCNTRNRYICEMEYIFSDTRKSWSDARRECKNANGHLVTFENADENSRIKALIQFKGSLDNYWTGLNDIETEGTFVWSSSGSSMPGFRSWDKGEPNGGFRENCVEMKHSRNLNWNDQSCNSKNRYVCKMGVTTPVPSKKPRTAAPPMQGEFVIRHYGGKCVSIHQDGRLYLTTRCTTRFTLTKNKSLKHVTSGKCVVPESHSNDRKFKLQTNCNDPNTKYEQTKLYSTKHILSGKCWHPFGGTSQPREGTYVVIWDGCDQTRLRFKFEGKSTQPPTPPVPTIPPGKTTQPPIPPVPTIPPGKSTLRPPPVPEYVLSDTKQNWFNARGECNQAHGQLVTFENAYENNKIKALIRAKGGRDNYWTGLNDIKTEGTFIWSATGSTLPDFRNWNAGEPNGGFGESCVEMKFSRNLEWNDQPCYSMNRYICKMGNNTHPPTLGPTPPLGPCGISAVQSDRVIAGVDAKQGAWPWQILMLYGDRAMCGGSLVAPYWVVTAAHCVSGRESRPWNFKIRVGEHDWRSVDGKEDDISVTRIISHPHYSRRTLDSDIALMKLSRPAKMNRFVSRICLPEQDRNVPVGTQCYITGWGKIHHPGSMHHTLQQAKIPVVSKQNCTDLNTKNTRIKITDNMVCAGHGGSTKVIGCHGDSGGPFVCQTGSNGRWELHGAVSWGSGSCDATRSYTAFARVAVFKDWLDQTMRNY